MATDAQPQSLPLLSASTTGASTSATSTVPAQSIERERVGSRDSWTVRSVTGMQTAAIAASIQNRPCQPVVSTSTPPISGPSAPPAADAAPHSVTARICDGPDEATDSRLMPQARIVAPDAPWIIRPPTTPAAPVDSAISAHERDEQREPGDEHLAAPEHVAERARGDDHGGADERIAGHRPLQLGDRRADVLADRRQQDRHGRRVRVDHQRRHAGGEQDAAAGLPVLAAPPSVLDHVVGLEVVELVLELLQLLGAVDLRGSAPRRAGCADRRSPAGDRRSRRRWSSGRAGSPGRARWRGCRRPRRRRCPSERMKMSWSTGTRSPACSNACVSCCGLLLGRLVVLLAAVGDQADDRRTTTKAADDPVPSRCCRSSGDAGLGWRS